LSVCSHRNAINPLSAEVVYIPPTVNTPPPKKSRGIPSSASSSSPTSTSRRNWPAFRERGLHLRQAQAALVPKKKDLVCESTILSSAALRRQQDAHHCTPCCVPPSRRTGHLCSLLCPSSQQRVAPLLSLPLCRNRQSW